MRDYQLFLILILNPIDSLILSHVQCAVPFLWKDSVNLDCCHIGVRQKHLAVKTKKCLNLTYFSHVHALAANCCLC